jgi:hypothetical protein
MTTIFREKFNTFMFGLSVLLTYLFSQLENKVYFFLGIQTFSILHIVQTTDKTNHNILNEWFTVSQIT